MSDDAVKNKILAMVCKQLDLPDDKVTLETNYLEDLKADSLDIAELVMEMEDEFDVNISDQKEGSIATVGDTITFIEGELQKKAG